MDTLFHFVLAFIGGYVLVKGLKVRYSIIALFFLALLSTLIDLDHIFTMFVLHNIFFVIIPLGILLIFLEIWEYYSEDKRCTQLQVYSLVLMVMLIGHLLADMISGIGIPLLYPLSDSLYVIPQWNLHLTGDHYLTWVHGSNVSECLITPAGIVLALYFGLIFLYHFGSKARDQDK